jgi:hypothetical protein
MASKTLWWVLLPACMMVIAGCASGNGRGLDPGPSGAARIAKEGPDRKSSDYPVDVAQLIRTAVHGPATSKTANADTPSADGQASAADIELARRVFYDACSSNDSTTNARCGTLRDRVQDRLLWASDSACADYLGDVRRSFTSTNLNLGGATTLFGALGSILNSKDAIRVFSGAAGVTSGLRAEYNDVYFSSQAFEVVSKAIRNIREKALKSINDERRNKGIRDYTLEAAIADATRYHASCNVMAGLEEAADAVTRDRDPGLKRMSELLQGVGAGMNLSLGTAALDSGALPSAAQSCRELATIGADGAKLAKDYMVSNAAYQKLEGVDENLKKKADDQQVLVNKAAADLKKLVDDSAADCTGKDATATKLETEMFDTMRIFASLPLSEKAVGKAQFDAARAKVMALKAKIDSTTSDARIQYQNILANAKLPK